MDHLAVNLDEVTKTSQSSLQALFTDANLQVTVSSLKPGEIVSGCYPEATWFFYIVHGHGHLILPDAEYELTVGSGLAIPRKHSYCLKNTGHDGLKYFSVTAPATVSPCYIECTDECGRRQITRS
jgi:mannose-6-phosphate isomerase-like protein (cupin superfamily)